MTHTPEPWRPGRASNAHTEVRASALENAPVVAVCLPAPAGSHEANARRVAACVNACAALGTEALEVGALPGLIKAAKVALERLDREDAVGADRILRRALILLLEEPPPRPPKPAAERPSASAPGPRKATRGFIEDRN